ncbi:bacillithiol biosynthesis deacetylase BshB1 [Melioribacteraceae bacterium 4301-Me]|uniref:bacillithiol biosynthesis deacetylase BshB1 n=1 Tax=Pyranulibacter aquaticus TaxID=3163344 RepID=UPI003598C360
MQLDVLVFAAHPDDAELGMGGTIAKLINSKIKVGVIDLSKGEMGTRGSAETRKKEALKAAKILNLSLRENLGIKDGSIKLNEKHINAVVKKIRQYQPQIIFAPYKNDRHPDHIGTSRIVKEAFFYSGLTKVITKLNGKIQVPYRPKKIFYYMQNIEFYPSFVVDISDTFQTKMESVLAYKTQFFNPESREPETFISQPNFLKFVEARAKNYGFRIGKDYGEPFYSEDLIELDLSNYIFSGEVK